MVAIKINCLNSYQRNQNKKAFKNFLILAKGLIQVYPLVAAIIFTFAFSSCFKSKEVGSTSQEYNITQEEKVWLKEFFRDLLFNSPGAYTLYGAKPISISNLTHLTEANKQKLEEDYQLLSEEEKSNLILRRYDFTTNYNKWEKIKDRFPIRQYLFGTFPSPYENSVELVLFVNVEMAVKTLLDHYEDFHRLLGFDFDPLEVVFEIENKASSFWNAILKNHVLLGILLGFGKNQSWFFEWNMKYKNAQDKIDSFIRSLPKKTVGEEYVDDYGPQHFSLPAFIEFGLYPDQATVKQYEAAREKIKALYKGKDEVDLAIKWLTR